MEGLLWLGSCFNRESMGGRACWEAAAWGAGLGHEWEIQFYVCNVRRFNLALRPTLSLHEKYYSYWNWYFKNEDIWEIGVCADMGTHQGPFYFSQTQNCQKHSVKPGPLLEREECHSFQTRPVCNVQSKTEGLSSLVLALSLCPDTWVTAEQAV